MNGTPIPVNDMLHLKTGINCIERNTLLITGKFLSDPAFQEFSRIPVEQTVQ